MGMSENEIGDRQINFVGSPGIKLRDVHVNAIEYTRRMRNS
jgi:hypothetical protein